MLFDSLAALVIQASHITCQHHKVVLYGCTVYKDYNKRYSGLVEVYGEWIIQGGFGVKPVIAKSVKSQMYAPCAKSKS